MNQSPIEITLNITEYKNYVNLSIIDDNNLSFSVDEEKEVINLIIKEEGEDLNICITEGRDGLSAYEIWLSLGNHGTEQDYINSLKGEKGDKGDGSDAYYLHIQSQPSEQWICHHNLNKYPSVPYIMDSAGNVHFASPININLNTSIIKLGTPMAGSAPFN